MNTNTATMSNNNTCNMLFAAIANAPSIKKRDAILEDLWDRFADIPMDPDTECMEAPFLHWPAGTHREEIWHEFDKQHSKGVVYLLYGNNADRDISHNLLPHCKKCDAAECVYNHAGTCRFLLTHERFPIVGSEHTNCCAEFQPNIQAKFVKAYNIDWDLEEGDSAEDLPSEMIIPLGIPKDEIDDYISNVSGFCIWGCDTTKPQTLEKHRRDAEPVNILLAMVDKALSAFDGYTIDLVVDEESGQFVVMYHSHNNSFIASDSLLDASMLSEEDKEKLVAELDARNVGHCW